MATGYVYVLPLHNEDWLKLGVSNNPLRRAREFSLRFFDAFDLDQAILVETEGMRDAALLEKRLKQSLREHRAPRPLTIRTQAGGHTEWLRGAYPAVLDACLTSPLTVALHTPAWNWFARAQWEERMLLNAWTSTLLRNIGLEPDVVLHERLPAALQLHLSNALDAFHAFGWRVEDYLPAALQEWYAKHPELPPSPSDID
jgi:hypothetical protein